MKIKSCPHCFRILSDKNRSKIVSYLKKERKANVTKINSLFRLSQPTISHHLKILKRFGILKSKKIGKEIYYFLNKNYSCPQCKIFKLPYFR